MPGKMFVNYRRNDGAASAARVRDRLVTAFGAANVFMDVDNLLAGQRFDKELEKALAATDVFLAVIGPKWMDLLKARTDSDERDYVREEIAGALKRGIMVIPVLIEHAVLPRGVDLPDDIREMVLHQKHDISHEHFGRDVEALVIAIKAGRKAVQSEAATPKTVRWGIIASGVCIAALAVAAIPYMSWQHAPTVRAASPVMSPDPKQAELERKRHEELDQEMRREREARSKAEAENRQQADAAALLKREEEARQIAEVAAKVKAEEAKRLRLTEAAAQAKQIQEAQRKTDADAAAKAKAEEAERQRVALDRKRKADEETAARNAEGERQRVAAETQRKVDEEAVAKRTAEERQLAVAGDNVAWLAAKDMSTPDAMQAYLDKYPDGLHAREVAADFQVLLTKAVQTALQKIGCDPGDVDGRWGAKARNALRDYARYAKITLKSEEPTLEHLKLISQRTERLCPPVSCDQGEKLVNGQCVAVDRSAQVKERQPANAKSRSCRKETWMECNQRIQMKAGGGHGSTGARCSNPSDWETICN